MKKANLISIDGNDYRYSLKKKRRERAMKRKDFGIYLCYFREGVMRPSGSSRRLTAMKFNKTTKSCALNQRLLNLKSGS